MALANSIVGAGILISYSSDINQWIEGTFVRVKVQEVSTQEVREWVALTEAAADAAAKAASQIGLNPGEVASYSASEDSRVVGSYKLTKTITKKTVSVVA